MHTDLDAVGGFDCSDERINRLHRVAEWSFRGNACEIPTDCPTRERSGWVGDWQLYVDTAAYLYDVADFSAKWLRDLAADQLDERRGHQHRPRPQPRTRPSGRTGHGAAGWGDAAVHVPWELYRATGRTDVLADQFDVDAALGRLRRATRAATGRHPSRVEQRPDPLPHETLPVGQRLALRRVARTRRRHGRRVRASSSSTTTARSPPPTSTARPTSCRASPSVLGDREATRPLRAASPPTCSTRGAPSSSTTTATSTRTPRRTSCAPSPSGSSPTTLREPAAADLVALIRAADTHLGTGFLATPFLLPVLADHGHLDVAYELLFQDTEPSWLHMSDRTTTIWEDWDAVRPDGTVTHSLNHYSKGAVISFLHRYVAGLAAASNPATDASASRPDPAAASPARAPTTTSPHGRIDVSWQPRRRRGRTSTSPSPTATEAELSGCPTARPTPSAPAPTAVAGATRNPIGRSAPSQWMRSPRTSVARSRRRSERVDVGTLPACRMTLVATALGVLERNRRGAWTCPADGIYPHQWLWDSCFVAIGLAAHDPERAAGELRAVLRGQWSNGMVPHMVFAAEVGDLGSARLWQSRRDPRAPRDVDTSCITQPPLLAIAAWFVARHLGEAARREFLDEIVPRIVAHHRWLYRERDLDGRGLVTLIHPWECGLDTTPPWMDALRRFPAPAWMRLVLRWRLTRIVRFFRRDTRFIPAAERSSDDDGLRMLVARPARPTVRVRPSTAPRALGAGRGPLVQRPARRGEPDAGGARRRRRHRARHRAHRVVPRHAARARGALGRASTRSTAPAT